MRKVFVLVFLSSLVLLNSVIIWSEDFETDGQGTRYTASTPFNDGSSDHWNRTDGADISNVSGVYTNYHETYFWATEDTDDDGGNGSDEQTIVFSNIDISGKTGLTFKGLFGAGNNNGPGESFYDNLDYIKVIYSIDGGIEQNGIWFSNEKPVAPDVSNEPIGLDANFDGDSDVHGTNRLGTSMQEFGFNIASGSSLELTIKVYMDSASEEIGFDYLRIEDDQILPVTLTEFTATLLYSEYVSIIWVTQSESNISHYNLYRDELFLGSRTATNTTSTTTYEFIDADIEDGADYAYTLEAVELDGEIHNYGPYTVHVDLGEGEDIPPNLPEITDLVGNYPNPFNPSTTIYFNVKAGETATLSIFNPKGQIVEKMSFTEGSYHHVWEANDLDSGIYFFKLESASYSNTKKMVILK